MALPPPLGTIRDHEQNIAHYRGWAEIHTAYADEIAAKGFTQDAAYWRQVAAEYNAIADAAAQEMTHA